MNKVTLQKVAFGLVTLAFIAISVVCTQYSGTYPFTKV
jgi:hypothetical protein